MYLFPESYQQLRLIILQVHLIQAVFFMVSALPEKGLLLHLNRQIQ